MNLKVFLSRSFDDRDDSITSPFIHVLEDLGVDIVQGKGISPESSDKEILQRISRCHAFVGIISRERNEDETFPLPKINIVQEIAAARTLDKDLLLFEEEGTERIGFIDNNCLRAVFNRDNLATKISAFKKELERILKTRVDPQSADRKPWYTNRFSSSDPEVRLTWGNRTEVADLAGGQAIHKNGGVNDSGCLLVVNTEGNWNWKPSKSIITLERFGSADGIKKGDEIYLFCRVKAIGDATVMLILSGGWAENSKANKRWINLCKEENRVPDSEGEWDEYFWKYRLYAGEDLDIREKGHPLHIVTNTGTGVLHIDEIEFGKIPQ